MIEVAKIRYSFIFVNREKSFYRFIRDNEEDLGVSLFS